jgi:putative membrane protein
VRDGRGRALLFWLGLGLIYGALQTHFDYYAQHMFFMHRLQHLLLHHLAPFLIALAAPAETLSRGLPQAAHRYLLAPLRDNRRVGQLYALLQQPAVAALLFVGLIYLWLLPELHFLAMLNLPLYNAMNWGMALDGLLFWWMVFNLRTRQQNTHHYGGRILLLFLMMFPQIAIGAHITFARHELYEVYALCGRIWPLSAGLDQVLGGLVTWIPSAMMSIAASLVLLHRWNSRRRIRGEVGETRALLGDEG